MTNDFLRTNLVRYLLLLCAVRSVLQGVVALSCDSVPISVSDITSCVNGDCLTTQRANVVVSATAGSKACFVFKDILSGAVLKTVNLTVDRADFIYPVDFCYDSDDMVASSFGFCGCPGGNSATCTSCPVSNTNPGVALCSESVHNHRDCFLDWLGSSGTYCLKHRFSGFPRFRVCKLKTSFIPDFQISVTDGTNGWMSDFYGNVVQFDHSVAKVNVTIVSTTSNPTFLPQFVVYDRHDTSDFYLLDNSFVNSINDFDMDKIGWAKITDSNNITLPSDLEKRITSSINSCSDNTFHVRYPFKQVSSLLKSSANKLSSKIVPRMSFQDFALVIQSGDNLGDPNHNVDMPLIKNGYTFFPDGFSVINPQFIGITQDGAKPVTVTITAIDFPTGNVTRTKTNATSVLCGSLFCNRTSTGACFDANSYRLCYKQGANLEDNFCIIEAVSGVCQYTTSVGLRFFPGESIFNVKSSLLDNGNLIVSSTPIAKPLVRQLYQPSTLGVISIVLSFKNYTISFPSTIAKPKISTAAQASDFIVVSAFSQTSPGDCFVGSDPASVVTSQKISLTSVKNDYKLPINTQVTGNISVHIRCGQNFDSKSLLVKELGTETLVPQEEANTPPVVPFTSLEDFSNLFSSPSHFLSGFNPIDDFNIGTILVWVGAIAALFLVGTILVFVARRMMKRKMFAWIRKGPVYIKKKT
jgi:hypothetical protein